MNTFIFISPIVTITRCIFYLPLSSHIAFTKLLSPTSTYTILTVLVTLVDSIFLNFLRNNTKCREVLSLASNLDILVYVQILLLKVRLDKAALKYCEIVLIGTLNIAALIIFFDRSQVTFIDMHHRIILLLLEVEHSKQRKKLLLIF